MPIKTEDPQAIEKLEAKLKELTERQDMMKNINLILRNSRTSKAEKIKLVCEKYQLKPETVEKLMNPQYSFEKSGFQTWELSNGNAEISRIKKRIKHISRYQAEAREVEETGELPEIEFDGGSIVDNVPYNRIQIFFDEKPDADVRRKLKQNGFRWAPGNGAWQSYRNQYTLDWAKQEFNVENAK
ncbi:MAG: hypothetical protein PHV82_01070 [Victivallaceae bacterium]|nr:hypothetical protein [Victivallaceae bacterium]